jgi:hypothetical protein
VNKSKRIRNSYKILIRNPEEKGPLGRPRCWCEYTIKMDGKERVCDVMNWIHLAQGGDDWRAVMNAVMKLQVP